MIDVLQLYYDFAVSLKEIHNHQLLLNILRYKLMEFEDYSYENDITKLGIYDVDTWYKEDHFMTVYFGGTSGDIAESYNYNTIYMFLIGYDKPTVEMIDDMLFYYRDSRYMDGNILYGWRENLFYRDFSQEVKDFIDEQLELYRSSEELRKILR